MNHVYIQYSTKVKLGTGSGKFYYTKSYENTQNTTGTFTFLVVQYNIFHVKVLKTFKTFVIIMHGAIKTWDLK